MVKTSLPGSEDTTRVELTNGIVVLVRSNFNSPTVAIKGYITAGSLFDSPEKLGCSVFTAAALSRGTTTRSFEEIFNLQESVGASFGISSGTHITAFNGHSLVEDLPLILDLLSDELRNPAFPHAELERMRRQFLTSLNLRAQNTGAIVDMTFDKMIYGDHIYARPDEGYPETIKAITRDDLISFHKQAYGPKGMVVCVVGAVEAQEAIDLVQKTLGDWSNPLQLPPVQLSPVAPFLKSERQDIALPGKVQTDLVMGTLAMERKSPDYLPAILGNSVLGQFGMMGRIGEVVRERSGLAYYASSSVSGGTLPGTWDVQAGVNPSNLEKAIDLIKKEISLFVKEGVTEEELSDSQEAFIGRLPLSLESNSGVAKALVSIERKNLGLDHYYSYETRVRSVTPEMVVETARKYLGSGNFAIATCGPALSETQATPSASTIKDESL